MNRRGFLGSILGAFALDPERLLYRPGAKLISIPQPRVRIEFDKDLDTGLYVRYLKQFNRYDLMSYKPKTEDWRVIFA